MVDPLIARLNRLMWGDLSAYGFHRPPLGLKATVERRGRIPTLADELIDAVRVGRVEVVGAVKAVEPDRVILADGTSVAAAGDHRRHRVRHGSRRFGRPSWRPRRTRQPARRIRLARRRWNVRDRIRHSAQWPTPGDPRQRHAIGPGNRGLPKADWSTVPAPLGWPRDFVAPGRRRTVDGRVSLARQAETASHEKQGDAMVLLSAEKTFFRGADGYETARRETVWNGLLPERFPDVIVQAHDTDDVVAAIRYARANGHHVGVRSGGHSWAASHLRDGGLLLDVSRLDHCTVDTGSDDRRRRPGQDRQRVRDRTRLTRALLSRGSLRRHSPRWLSAAGRIRLEQLGARPGMRERAWTGSRHRRR